MSMSSLKSRSSLTPIEDTEVDRLDFLLNSSKSTSCNDRESEWQLQNSVGEAVETRAKESPDNVDERRSTQDTYSLDRSGTNYSQSDTSTIGKPHRPRSRSSAIDVQAEDEVYGEGGKNAQRQSTGNVDNATRDSSQSLSVLMVRESPSDRILDSVDDTSPDVRNDADDVDDDDVNADDDDDDDDDDDYDDDDDDDDDDEDEEEEEEEEDDEEEMDDDDSDDDYDNKAVSDFSSQSGNENSLHDSNKSEPDQPALANRHNVRSRNDLSNIEEEEVAIIDDDQNKDLQLQKPQSNDGEDGQLILSSSIVEHGHDRVSQETIRSKDETASVNNYNSNEPSNVRPDREKSPSHSVDYLNRTDSVENSYFASFRHTESIKKSLQEKQQTEFMVSSPVSCPVDESTQQGFLPDPALAGDELNGETTDRNPLSESSANDRSENPAESKNTMFTESESMPRELPSSLNETNDENQNDNDNTIHSPKITHLNEEFNDNNINMNDEEVQNTRSEMQLMGKNITNEPNNHSVERDRDLTHNVHPEMALTESAKLESEMEATTSIIGSGEVHDTINRENIDKTSAAGSIKTLPEHSDQFDKVTLPIDYRESATDEENSEIGRKNIEPSESVDKGGAIEQSGDNNTYTIVSKTNYQNGYDTNGEQCQQLDEILAPSTSNNIERGGMSARELIHSDKGDGLHQQSADVHGQIVTEPRYQEIEREPITNSVNVMDEVLIEPAVSYSGRTSPSTFVSEDSEPMSETRGGHEQKYSEGTGMIRVTKSSSTMSVKTASSSSSRSLNSARRSKVEENKKLELLLKGPYSEPPKPSTPRLRMRQGTGSANIKKKGFKSQDKTKGNSGSMVRKSGSSKLQVHKTKKKSADKPHSNNDNLNVLNSDAKDNGNTENPNVLPSQLNDVITKQPDTDDSNSVNPRNIQHVEEAVYDLEVIEETRASANQPFAESYSEYAKAAKVEKEALYDQTPSIRDEHQREELDPEKNERIAPSVVSSDTQIPEIVSLGTKPDGIKGENESSTSDSGRTVNVKSADGNNGENKPAKQSFQMGKKKIIISSPKASERLSAKEAKNATPVKHNGTTTPNGVQKKGSTDSKRPLTAPNSNKKVESVDSGLIPAAITIIDETSDSPKTNPTAGRIILNNIKMNLQKKSMVKHNKNSMPKTSKGKSSRSPSPEGNSLSNSGKRAEGKPAYKTQSMSSLQVPGQLATPNSWDAPKEEDGVSMHSRRPSMDSVSRKSVDYRIRHTATVIQPQLEEKPKSVFNKDESYIQNAVPSLPLGLAILFLVLNTLLPGSGTALSGVSILCCGHSRLSNKEDQILNTMCANIIVGLAQLLTVSFLLVGWFWSVGWGIKMVSLSVKRRQEIKQQREKDLQTLALSAFGSPKRLTGFGA